MRVRWAVAASLLALSLASVGTVRAQGVQTGDLTGTVLSEDGLSLPGAVVTVSSPALQGTRTAVTDTNGLYIFHSLPPGVYRLSFEFPGMRPLEDTATVPLGGTATVTATLQLAALAEAITVTGEVAPAVAVTTTAANFTAGTIDTLPAGRTPALIAELAPGLTVNTPNVGQVTISGGFGYDNVFMINGVDVNDNIFGTAYNLFIEDAIAETTVLTSGIPAEYGRFSGGVINVITKSGGNDFSGSFRQNLSNPAWTDETPFEKAQGRTRGSDLSETYEATFGGPVAIDRAWFFAAGRYEESSTSTALPETNLPFTSRTTNKRYELKGTVTPIPNHTIQSSFIDNSTDRTRVAFTFSIDPNVVDHPSNPNRLFSASWNGVLASRLFASLQVSRRTFGIRGAGGQSTDPRDSPMVTNGVFGVPGRLHFNAPFFDATDPQDRNNRQFAGSLAYFLSTATAGSHDLKVGFDHFTSNLRGGNSQTATGFIFNTDYVTNADGSPLIVDGRLVPRFDPLVILPTGQPVPLTIVQNWLPARGANIDIRTLSLFAQDRWAVNRNLSLDLGLRYERVRSEATGGIIGVDTDRIAPRLGASYDVRGNGSTVLQATYAHYSGKYSEAQITRNTSVGNPDLLVRVYTGPPGQGRDFAPGYDLANYPLIIFRRLPAANVFFDDNLKSPVAREVSFAVGQELGVRGWMRVTLTGRSYGGFIDDFIDDPSAAGKVPIARDGIPLGVADRIVWRNTDAPDRLYRGLQIQASYRAAPRTVFGGHWTVQLKNEGDFEGEATNAPGIGSPHHNHPEILVAERNFPSGRLDDFQRHKVRLWVIHTLDLGRLGSLGLAPLWRIDSGLTYSLAARNVPLSAVQLARNPGYADLPGGGRQDEFFFGDRGSQQFKGYGLLDLSASYDIPVWRTLRPWLKIEILNVLNNQKLIRWDTTITPDPNSPLDAHGLPTGYLEGPRFGEGTAATNYPGWRTGFDGGRTFLVAWGARF